MQSDRESGWFRRISLMQGPLKAIHVAALVAFALLIALHTVPRAQQPPAAPPAPAAPPPAVPAPAKPLVPVATNTVTAHPDAYYGQAVVINEKFVDLAKRLPPPLNAEEEAYQKVMRQVGPAFAALRPAVEASNAETAAKNAAVLQKAFTDTEAFWKPKKAEPTLWAQNARKEVEAVQAAIAAGKWDDAKAHAATVGQACAQCHGAYRERFDDGSFRIKK